MVSSSNQDLIESCHQSSEVSSNFIRDYPHSFVHDDDDANQGLCQSMDIVQETIGIHPINNVSQTDMPQISLNYNSSTDYLESDFQDLEFQNLLHSQQQAFQHNVTDLPLEFTQGPINTIHRSHPQCSTDDIFPMISTMSSDNNLNTSSFALMDENLTEDIFKSDDYFEDANRNIGSLLQFLDSDDVRENKSEADTSILRITQSSPARKGDTPNKQN